MSWCVGGFKVISFSHSTNSVSECPYVREQRVLLRSHQFLCDGCHIVYSFFPKQ